jgi:PAS domain S-box-containing protein
MKEPKKNIQIMLLLGVVFAVAVWLLQAFVYSHYFKNGNFYQAILRAEPSEMWERSLTAFLILTFGVLAEYFYGKLRITRNALQEAQRDLEIEHERRINTITDEAEEALKGQIMFAENLIKNSAVATFVLNSEHKIIKWNRACEELTGKKEQEMLGTDNHWTAFYDYRRPTVADIVMNNDSGNMAELYNLYSRSNLIQNGLHAEGWYPGLGGKNRYIMFDGAPIYNARGEIVAAIETLQDVTALKKADEQLKHSFSLITATLESTTDGIYVVDVLGKMTGFNQKFIDMWRIPASVIESGYDDEIVAVILEQVLDPDEFVDRIITLYSSPSQERVEVVKCKDGRVFERYSIPQKIDDLIVGRVLSYRDVTQRANSEKRLKESETKFRAIASAASDAIIMINSESKILYWNYAAERILGYSEDEALGKEVTFLMPLRYRDDHLKGFNKYKSLESEELFFTKTYMTTALKKDGTEIPIELSVSVFPLNGIWHSVGIVRDNTERIKLEDQLRQSQKMEAVGQLAGGIAHDFNNILTAIIGYASLLEIKMSKEDQLNYNVRQIIVSAEKAAHLVQNLLAFSRKQRYLPRMADVNSVVKSVQKLLTRIIGEDIELKVMPSQERLPAMIDVGQMEQILMNLATNARDAMLKGGILLIETKSAVIDAKLVDRYGGVEPGRYAVISVTDTGAGIDQKIIEKIFDPFFTTKDVGKGTGLGLSMAYGIIKQHGGHINVYSEIGKGTTFRIYVPLSEENSAAALIDETSRTASSPTGTETLLLAEDDKVVLNITRDILKEFGYTVIVAVDGEDAIKVYTGNRDKIDMIIMDVIMPKVNGWEAYQAIKDMSPEIKVLFLSGYTASIIHKQSGLEEGLNFISKPVSPNELLKKIREILDNKTLNG